MTTLIGSRIRVPSSVGMMRNSASDGIVYRSPVTDTAGAYTQRYRRARYPSGSEITRPSTTGRTDSQTCDQSRLSTSARWSAK
jgi:hypothetical protein